MRMKKQKAKWLIFGGLALLLVLVSISGGISLYHTLTQKQAGTRTITLGAQHAASAPTPFMYRPYYGSRSISSRTVSFVDHDKPWYDYDGVFVRYDGQKWTGVSIGYLHRRRQLL